MFSPAAIANELIVRAQLDESADLNPTQLHELVYLAQGWYLGQTGEPLMNAHVSAWRDGVFIPPLREQGCWGTRSIHELLTQIDSTAGGMMKSSQPRVTGEPAALSTLDWIWKTYGVLTPFELSRVVREKNAPWDTVWHHPSRTREEPYDIPPELMRKWFMAEVRLHHIRAGSAKGLSDTGQFSSQDTRETTQQFVLDPNEDELRPL